MGAAYDFAAAFNACQQEEMSSCSLRRELSLTGVIGKPKIPWLIFDGTPAAQQYLM